MTDWIFAAAFVVGALVAASATYRLLCRPYKVALMRIVDASKRPRGEGFGPALEDADELLRGRR